MGQVGMRICNKPQGTFVYQCFSDEQGNFDKSAMDEFRLYQNMLGLKYNYF